MANYYRHSVLKSKKRVNRTKNVAGSWGKIFTSKPKRKKTYNASYIEKRAFWTGFGARLVRIGKRGTKKLLTGYYYGKQAPSFRNGIAAADRFTSRYK